MRDSTGSSEQVAGGNADDDIPAITDRTMRQQIINLANSGRTVRQIASDTGLSLRSVGQVIKQRQKAEWRRRGGTS